MDTGAAIKAFEIWLSRDTCMSGHGNDRQAFYDFVWAFWVAKQEMWDEAEVKSKIITKIKEFHPNQPDGDIERFACEMRFIGTEILCFLKHISTKGVSITKDENIVPR